MYYTPPLEKQAGIWGPLLALYTLYEGGKALYDWKYPATPKLAPELQETRKALHQTQKKLEEQQKQQSALRDTQDKYSLGGAALGGSIGTFVGPKIFPHLKPVTARVASGLGGAVTGGLLGHYIASNPDMFTLNKKEP